MDRGTAALFMRWAAARRRLSLPGALCTPHRLRHQTLRSSVMRPLVVAVDGPAASGKGTIARLLAERLGLAHMDTGEAPGRSGPAGPGGTAAAACSAAELTRPLGLPLLKPSHPKASSTAASAPPRSRLGRALTTSPPWLRSPRRCPPCSPRRNCGPRRCRRRRPRRALHSAWCGFLAS